MSSTVIGIIALISLGIWITVDGKASGKKNGILMCAGILSTIILTISLFKDIPI